MVCEGSRLEHTIANLGSRSNFLWDGSTTPIKTALPDLLYQRDG